MPPTHEIFNQPPALTGYDVADDLAMLSALRREGAGWAEDAVRELGRLAGSAQAQEHGRQANENPPTLRLKLPHRRPLRCPGSASNTFAS